MPNGQPGGEQVRFGSFEFDTHSLELRRAGRAVALAPQPAQLLRALLAHAGEIVSREELRSELWSHDTFVDFEAGLNYCLGRLRAVLGDDARKPAYIETLPRRGYRFVAETERVGTRLRTLAVLPFDNIGGDPGEEFVADGVADGLITELGKIAGLRVISRQSVLAFKGSKLPMSEIAQRLNADTVLEGSVLQRGDRLRITSQLIEVNPERHLWAESYEGDPGDFMDLLVRVARAVARAVCVILAPEDEARLAHAATPRACKPEAQTAYLKARFHLGKWSGVEFEKGLTLLHQAIALDPSHAAAHASLGACLSLLGYNGHAPWRIVYPQAKAMALKAVELDPFSSAAHTHLGFLHMVYDWDFEAADACFRRARETGPNNGDALLTHSMFLLWIRDDRERALAQTRTALALDPVSPFTNSMVLWLMLMASEFDEVVTLATRTLEMYPDAHQAVTGLAWARVHEGRLTDAVGLFERAAAASPDPITMGFLGHVYALAGRTDDARRILDKLTQADPAGHACVKSIISVLTGLGEIDQAFEWMDRGIAERDGGVLSARVSPPFWPLMADARFEQAACRMGLAPREAAGHSAL